MNYKSEPFPARNNPAFRDLFASHGVEVRGRPFHLDFSRYRKIEAEGRLSFIVARDGSVPVGYACGWWYLDLHFEKERVAVDDLWYVHELARRRGIGRDLKMMLHAEFAKVGVLRIYDSIRESYHHPQLMADLGFSRWGVRWVKHL